MQDRTLLAACLAIAGLGVSATFARAASTCYDDTAYPVVQRLAVVAGGVRIELGSVLSEANPHETLTFRQGAGWSPSEPVDCSGGCGERPEPCAESTLPIPLSVDEYLRARPERASERPYLELDQQAVGCVESGGYRWFGISFYSGEGVVGLGGIGRRNLQSGAQEVRRHETLVQVSVDEVIVRGSKLWLATARHHECSGERPAAGLLEYDWESGSVKPVREICGNVVNDVLEVGSEIWVATDLGLSIGRPVPGAERLEWQNFAPDAKAAEPMRPVQCSALYDELLAPPGPFAGDGLAAKPRAQLIQALGTLHPEYEPRELAK